MTNANHAIAAAKLAVYIILLQPTLYVWWKHGKTGFLGWFYVQIFCCLRIATGIIGLTGNPTSLAAIIINSIGLSPLLLAIAGVLHEARRATNRNLNRRWEIFLDIQYHTIVAVAMALIVIAIVKMDDGSTNVSTMKTLLKVGSAVIALSWVLLVLWSIMSFATMKKVSNTPSPAIIGGRILLYGIFASLAFTVLRLVYALTYLQLEMDQSKSEFITSIAIQVCLSVVPEMIVTAILVTAGIMTRSLKQDIQQRDKDQRVNLEEISPGSVSTGKPSATEYNGYSC